MMCRRCGSKPTVALWMLVAVADVVLIAATAGLLTTLLVLGGLVTVTAVVLGVRMLTRRDTAAAAQQLSTAVPARRRA